MIIVFQRTGQRRYAVLAKRSPLPDLEMNPAPGFDALMPHDLLHLVVEAQLGLKNGIFGQLAAGGDAGTFHPIVVPGESSRAASRLRTRVRAKGKALLRKGREESAQSERATYICWYAWLARAKNRARKNVGSNMATQAKQLRGVGPKSEPHTLNASKIDEICKHLDDLSSYWSRLQVGESLSVLWPDLTVSESSGH